MPMDAINRKSWKKRIRSSFQQSLAPALLLTGLSMPGLSQALETDVRGYLGYVEVASDEDILCDSHACQGVLADTLFYGLSLSVQGEELGAQIVVAQDEDEDPELSIAQITARTGFGGVQASARLGKIIVPLGLYGSQRITPTARPGLVLPQSFFLNTYYDLLTLSEKGLAIEFSGESWSLKAAAFKPRKEVIERIVELPIADIPDSGQVSLLQDLLESLIGDALFAPPSGGSIKVVERQEFDGGYMGMGYLGESTRTDLGFVRLDLNGSRLDAINLGNAWLLGSWEPSIELFRLKFDDTGNKLEGASVNLTYSAESWQAFANAVLMDFEGTESREYTTGGAYYWNDNWSGLLALHRLEGSFIDANENVTDKVHSLSLSLAYSWQ